MIQAGLDSRLVARGVITAAQKYPTPAITTSVPKWPSATLTLDR